MVQNGADFKLEKCSISRREFSNSVKLNRPILNWASSSDSFHIANHMLSIFRSDFKSEEGT